MIRVEATEMEEARGYQRQMLYESKVYSPEFIPVVFLCHRLVNVLMSKHLQNQWQVVRVK